MPGAADAKALAAAMRQTLNLPATRFPMRANAAAREPQLHARCVSAAYAEQAADESRPLFVLHDGPPFANGSLHMGHFLNKTLKDVINRYQLLRGRRVRYVPGWDCHGLPIEHKALTLLQLEAMTCRPRRCARCPGSWPARPCRSSKGLRALGRPGRLERRRRRERLPDHGP